MAEQKPYCCQCGCGEEIPWKRDHRWRPPTYKLGHYQHRFLRSRPPDGWEPPSGFCECGCGEKTPIAKYSNAKRDQWKGYPLRFLHGHNARSRYDSGFEPHPLVVEEVGDEIAGHTEVHGYRYVRLPDHHLAMDNGYVAEHRLVWELANDRRLRANEHVHHVDGDRQNNDPENLVALTKAEHTGHHMRERLSDPEWTEFHTRRIRQGCANRDNAAGRSPEARRRQSERMKRVWADRKARGLTGRLGSED